MSNPPPSRGSPDDQPRPPSDAALGGADAVEKSTDVTGTDPERTRTKSAPAAKGTPDTGPNATWAIILFLAVGAVLVYLLGLGR